jgi:hypothetical protein
MNRWLSACVLVVLSTALPAAEDAEQLDAEFLEYLAQLEGDDDDWTLVAAAKEAQTAPRKDAETTAPKTSKQADRPAVDER